jgi:hypothetical protein
MLQTSLKTLFEWGLSHFRGIRRGATPTVANMSPTVGKQAIATTLKFKVQPYEKPTQSLKIPHIPAQSSSATYPVVSHK